jgi:hypothetical protein
MPYSKISKLLLNLHSKVKRENASDTGARLNYNNIIN